MCQTKVAFSPIGLCVDITSIVDPIDLWILIFKIVQFQTEPPVEIYFSNTLCGSEITTVKNVKILYSSGQNFWNLQKHSK